MIRNNKGLSLIEVLVSITILTIIGVAITTITTRTFSGNTKTALIGNIKQNGQAVLAILEKDIRESDTVVCSSPASPPSTIIVLLTKDGGKYIRLIMAPESGSVNGSLFREQLVFSAPIINASQLCDLTSTPLNTQNSLTPLTDSSSQSAISLKTVASNGFTVVKNFGFKDTVRVQFDLGPQSGNGTKVEETVGTANSVNFQTTVQIR